MSLKAKSQTCSMTVRCNFQQGKQDVSTIIHNFTQHLTGDRS